MREGVIISLTDEETEIPGADVAELGSRVRLWSPCLNHFQSHWGRGKEVADRGEELGFDPVTWPIPWKLGLAVKGGETTLRWLGWCKYNREGIVLQFPGIVLTFRMIRAGLSQGRKFQEVVYTQTSYIKHWLVNFNWVSIVYCLLLCDRSPENLMPEDDIYFAKALQFGQGSVETVLCSMECQWGWLGFMDHSRRLTHHGQQVGAGFGWDRSGYGLGFSVLLHLRFSTSRLAFLLVSRWSSKNEHHLLEECLLYNCSFEWVEGSHADFLLTLAHLANCCYKVHVYAQGLIIPGSENYYLGF